MHRLNKLWEWGMKDDGWNFAMIIRMLSPIIIIVSIVLLNGCTSAPVKVEVAKKVSIECGPEPRVSHLVLFDIKPVAYYDMERGKAYVEITMDEYQFEALNAKRIEQHFIALGALIEHYRGCVRDFNNANT